MHPSAIMVGHRLFANDMSRRAGAGPLGHLQALSVFARLNDPDDCHTTLQLGSVAQIR
jgi:hypothetical protein